jgi:hypothetical protein
MSFLKDESAFDPSRDGKIPLRRSPPALAARFFLVMASLLFSRHPQDALRWAWSMWARRRPMSYRLPWLTFDAIRYLDRNVHPGQRVFEFGSGHSTLYWADKGVDLVSVEDDPQWFDMVREATRGCERVDLRLEKGEANYLGRLHEASGDFDAILVDGSHRKACIAAAVGRVRPGGLLIVDNTDWHWMQNADALVPEQWQKVELAGFAPFIGHGSQTTVWRRP